MNCNPTDPVDGVDRRSVLAAGAAGLSLSLSGCVDTVRRVVDQDGTDQLSLSIVTVPADADRESIRIAYHLESHLESIGVDVTLKARSRTDFLKAVLIDHDFDIYVGQHPADYDPDFLYEALHSTYANEAGWQNPFGFDSMAFDTLLEDQRRADGEQRKQRLANVLRGVADEKPFDPICRPDEIRVANTTRFDGWGQGHLATRRGYLGLKPDAGVDRLNALVTDARPSVNVNPISATVRERGTVVDLLYDSLGTVVDGEVLPWLADSWEWVTGSEANEADAEETTEPTRPTTTARVSLREDCRFHDGKPVTAADVEFTYQFFQDTVLGRASPSPPPRYRGHASAIDDIEIEDEYTLRITAAAGTDVCKRAFTVPILPKHVWQSELEDRLGNSQEFSAPQGSWSLVTSDSIDPTGSGPFQFKNNAERDHLTLERFDDHFTLREDVEGDHLLAPLVDELRFTVDPGSPSSISRVASGNADVTSSMLAAYSLGDIPEDDPDVERLESPSWTFYHIGFNARTPPCSNLHFRRAICRLIDKEWIASEVFGGHAEPLAAPVTEEWTPDDLAWDGADPETPFAGTDGTLNVNAAHDAFQAAGYYTDDENRLQGRY
ncbi:ABC transporter substrate-binding protein [Haloterrigena salina]|uniref:ABC transporter substrate-binding protein n=1 Tax=Haloterrigena salina TaxID=504937 RepID=UPI000677D546|nr:ABC transporter substrate-binding protein [Haloterrigena salina]